MEADSEASQSAGWVAANASGAQGKAQPPHAGHHLPRPRSALSGGQARDLAMIDTVTGIASEKFLSETGKVKLP